MSWFLNDDVVFRTTTTLQPFGGVQLYNNFIRVYLISVMKKLSPSSGTNYPKWEFNEFAHVGVFNEDSKNNAGKYSSEYLSM